MSSSAAPSATIGTGAGASGSGQNQQQQQAVIAPTHRYQTRRAAAAAQAAQTASGIPAPAPVVPPVNPVAQPTWPAAGTTLETRNDQTSRWVRPATLAYQVAIQGNEHCRHNHRYQRCTKCRKTLLLTHFIRSKESSGEDFEVRERHHTCRHCHIKNLDNDRNNMVKNPSGRTWLDGEPDEYDRWYRGQIHDESMDVSGFIDVIEAVHALPFEKVTMVPDVDKTFPYWEC